MSVCIVGLHPWKSVRDLGITGPPGILVATDTRVTDQQRRPLQKIVASKQRRLSDNLVVCYTSMNLAATTKAIDSVVGSPTTSANRSRSSKVDVRRLGAALCKTHNAYGGFTEMIASVWPKKRSEVMLELMPPDYSPRLRQGIIGIGHNEILESFKRIFRDPPPKVSQIVETQSQLKAKGFDFPEPEILPMDALGEILGAFEQAIKEVDPPEVDFPLELLYLDQNGINPLQAVILRKSTGQRDKVTTSRATLPINPPAKITKYQGGPRRATQLFE